MNKQFVLVNRPDGLAKASDFTVREEKIGEPGAGEMLIQNQFASIDPAIRGWLDDVPSYLPPVQLGDAVRASTVAIVIESNAEGYEAGDWVMGLNRLEEYSVVKPDGFTNKIDISLVKSPTMFLSVMGAVGLTSYFGITEELKPIKGETMLISGAAGAVGSVAGQMAKLAGARVVGIAGGAEKCERLLNKYGFDAAVDYRGKDVETLTADIKAAAPEGIDVVFENVGGVCLDATLMNLKDRARIGVCGLISEYNSEPYGARNLWQLLVHCASIRGFLLSDHLEKFPEGQIAIAKMIEQGDIVFDEHIDEGLDNAYETFMRLFSGDKQGKLILKIAT